MHDSILSLLPREDKKAVVFLTVRAVTATVAMTTTFLGAAVYTEKGPFYFVMLLYAEYTLTVFVFQFNARVLPTALEKLNGTDEGEGKAGKAASTLAATFST